MAKHGIVEVDAEGVVTLKESSGLIGMVGDAATSLIAHQKAAIGYTKWIQLGAVAGLANMSGVQSTTGKVGFGVLGKNYYIGG